MDNRIKYELEVNTLKPIFTVRMNKVPNELSLAFQSMTERTDQIVGLKDYNRSQDFIIKIPSYLAHLNNTRECLKSTDN